MKKFAFLAHVRTSYRDDLRRWAKPLGWVPDAVYRYALRNRPISPFVWSDVTITPGATEPEGYIIMLPYTGRQLLEQQKAMLPLVDKAMKVAADAGAEILGLGALTSPITLGGKLVTDNPYLSITNGNAYTAVITWQKIAQLIQQSASPYPVVALVGATGSVGSLVSHLLARYQPEANYLLVARNERRLNQLADEMTATSTGVRPLISQLITDVKKADIVVLLTSAADSVLRAEHLKKEAVVLDDTQPRNTHPDILIKRPDVRIIDGGLVSIPHLKLTSDIGLPPGLSYACLAETMLLAKAGHEGHFSIGNPTMTQAEYISKAAQQFAHLGFGLAPDHSFGKRIAKDPPAPIRVAAQSREVVRTL